MALALEGRAMKDDIMLGDTPKALKRRKKAQRMNARGRLWKHSRLHDIDGLVPSLEDYFAFTVVRNPWDRMVSYYHWLRTQSFEHPVVTLAKKHTFAQFIPHPSVRRANRNDAARAYMTNAAGQEQCALYIRLEHFATDAAPLWAHLGFELSLPHLNRSDRETDYRSYFDAPSRSVVADDFAEDIDRFGYRF